LLISISVPNLKRVHCTFVELFDVENIMTLKSGFGYSRSLKMVPFKSVGTVSYSHSIVTMTIFYIFSDIKRFRSKIAIFSYLTCILRSHYGLRFRMLP